MSVGGTLRVWANETRGSVAGAKSHCRDCRKPITWFLTVSKARPVPINGHAPVPLQTARDVDTGHTIETHGSETLHWTTCPHRSLHR